MHRNAYFIHPYPGILVNIIEYRQDSVKLDFFVLRIHIYKNVIVIVKSYNIIIVFNNTLTVSRLQNFIIELKKKTD